MLLREEDREIWNRSATSLQYLVLDEFHTYDGNQGTDVALLLRRLGLMLKAHQPEGFLGEYASNPLGRVTPVATSATLGGKDDTQKVLDFAGTIFGELRSSSVSATTLLRPIPKRRSATTHGLCMRNSPSGIKSG